MSIFDRDHNSDRKIQFSKPINVDSRPGAVDPRSQQIDTFPLDAWEFDDPKKVAAPVVRLKSPWQFSVQADVDGVIADIGDMNNKNVVSPSEKKEIYRQWQIMIEAKDGIDVGISQAGISNTDAVYQAFVTAHNNLNLYLYSSPGILIDYTVSTTVDYEVFVALWGAWKTKESEIQSMINAWQLIKGVENTPAGTTIVPTAPVLTGNIMFNTAYLRWTSQANLTGAETIRVERSDASNFATHTDVATVSGKTFTEEGLALNGTDDVPTSRTYYYRVIRIVNGTAESSPSNVLTLIAASLSPRAIAESAITNAKIAALAVDMGKMATGIRPPRVVAALPANPYTGYLVGDTVVWTSDNKLYRLTSVSLPNTEGWTTAVATADLSGTISEAQIAANAISMDKMASGIRPPRVVAALPANPYTGYLVGDTVVWTSDNKLYRLTSVSLPNTEGWTTAVATADLSGTITEAQIASGAVSIGKMASGLRPPRVVASLPANPYTGYLVGDTVVSTSDNKLYRLTSVSLPNTEGWTTAVATADLSGTITEAQIASGAVSIAKFASTIRPPRVVAALPSTPFTDCASGDLFYLTTESCLYKFTGTAFVKAIGANDIVANSITAGEIAAGAIAADEIATNAVTAIKILAGAVTTDKMTANTINGDRITAGTLAADKITANSITAGQIATGAIAADEIATNAVTAIKILAGAVTTDKMTANTINGDRITAGTIAADKITANSITAGQIAAGAIAADEIAADAVTASKIIAGARDMPKFPTAYWSMDDVPEIPDDPAGVTYLQDAWADVDGWGASRCTLDYTTKPGTLILTATDINPGISRTIVGFDGKTIKARVRKISGSATTSTIRNTTGTLYQSDKLYSGLTTHIHDFFMPSGATGQLAIYPGGLAAGAIAGDVYEIDFIYVGTGAYLPNSLIDNSGNGNGITIKGSTPVLGTSGNALSREGINDYEVTDAVQTMPDLFWYHEIWTVPNHATQIQVLFAVGTAGTGRLIFSRKINTTELEIAYYNGTTTVFPSVSNFFPTTTIPVVADIVVNWLTGSVLVYKNGTLFATLSATSAVKPSSVLWYFGNQSLLLTTQFAGGIVDERRIYPYTPTEAQVKYLYENKTCQDGVIITDQLVAGCVTTSKMIANSISGDRIAANTLDASKIVADSITAGQIAAGAISATEIASDAVTSAKILAGSVLADKLSVIARNLVNNVTLSENIRGWGNVLEDGTGTPVSSTYDATEKAIKITSTLNNSVRCIGFKVDHSQIYKVVMRVKKSAAHGFFYIGLAGSTTAIVGEDSMGNSSQAELISPIDPTTRALSAATANFYATSAAVASTSYVEYIFYIVGSRRSELEFPGGANGTCAKLASTTNYIAIRVLNWSNTISTSLYVRDISVTDISGGIIVAENIKAGAITTAKLAADSVEADKINVVNLSSINSDLGTISAGKLFTTGDSQVTPLKSFINMDEGSMRMGTPTVGIEYDAVEETFAIRGVDMELTESDLTTYKYTGADRLSLTHEELSFVVRDAVQVELARLGYDRDRRALRFPTGPYAPSEYSWSAESLVLNEAVYNPSLIQQQDGTLRCVFILGADSKLYEVTKTLTGSWSAKSLVLNDGISYPSLIQQQDGTLRCVFISDTDNKLYEVTKTLAGSWSAKSLVLNLVIVQDTSLIQQQDGTLRCVFRATAGRVQEVTKTLTGSWSSESFVSPGSGQYPSLIQQQDGTLRCVYRNSSGNLYEVTKTLAGSWSSESLVLGEAIDYSSLIQQQDGTLRCIVHLAGDSKTYELTKTLTGSWSAKSLVLNDGISYPSLIQQQDGTLRCVFRGNGGILNEQTREMYAQMGAGIIESGTNANGTWQKFSDGTMKQWGTGTTVTTDNANGTIYYRSSTATFPQSFFDTNYTVEATAISTTQITWIGNYSKTSVSECVITICGGNNTATGYATYEATGRWRA